MSKSTLLAGALIAAIMVYVVLPIAVKDYSPDPAFSAILTGIIGLASLGNGKNGKDGEQ